MVLLVASTHPAQAEIIALARKTPLSVGAVADLAKKVPAELAAEASTVALDTAGAPCALVLAFTAAVGGAKVPTETAAQLVTEVLALDQVGPLVEAAAGGPVAALTAFLEAEGSDLELECLAMLLATDRLAGAPVPDAILRRGRWLARHKLEGDSSIWLGGAALRLKDAGLDTLAGPHINRAKRNKKVIDDALETSRLPPLDVLPELDGARLSSGFTVKKEGPSVGRNDPCTCGSGKKFKKCCDGKEAPISEPKLDPAALGPDQIALMRAPEIAALETERLSSKAFIEAFHRMLDFKRIDLAERMIAEAQRRKEPAELVARFVAHTLHATYDRGDLAAAERLFALVAEGAKQPEVLALDLLRKPDDLLARIEAEAHAALKEEKDGLRGAIFAATLLRFLPALGIFVARGALHEARTRDSRALLREIEDARDRLLISPFEMWWDVYDSFFDIAEEAKEQKKVDAKREKMKADLRAARAVSRKTSNELEKLQKRVAELDEVAPSGRSVGKEPARPASSPDPELADERRRLKSKIDELQRIIGEGQDERRELRRQLADREEDEPAPATVAKKEEVIDDDRFLDAGEVDLPRQILVPRFSDRASKILVDLSTDAADGVLATVAALAAGKPNVWGGVKKLSKVKGYYSARAGIHHRVLFALEERGLDVLDVLHRKDLEQAVTRLARIG